MRRNKRKQPTIIPLSKLRSKTNDAQWQQQRKSPSEVSGSLFRARCQSQRAIQCDTQHSSPEKNSFFHNRYKQKTACMEITVPSCTGHPLLQCHHIKKYTTVFSRLYSQCTRYNVFHKEALSKCKILSQKHSVLVREQN